MFSCPLSTISSGYVVHENDKTKGQILNGNTKAFFSHIMLYWVNP